MTHQTEKIALWQAAQLEAARFTVSPEVLQGRDLVDGYAIDEGYSPDPDDIAKPTPLGSDADMLRVSIAEVGTFITPGTDMFAYAAHQMVSHYRDRRVVSPMLPPAVSENKLCLKAGQPRPVISIHIPVDLEGPSDEVSISRDIAIAKAYTPKMVEKAIRGNNTGSPLYRLKKIAQRLFIARHDGRDIPFSLEDEEGHTLSDMEGFIGRFIVQECMIAANTGFAKYAHANNIPSPFRNMQLIMGEGSDTNPELLSVVARASYATVPLGHAALNVPEYLHGTAPLRRLMDLIFQGNLVAHEEEREYPYQGDFLEELLERANALTTKSSKRSSVSPEKKAELAKKRAATLLCQQMDRGEATGESIARMITDYLDGTPDEVQQARQLAAEYVAANILVAKTVLGFAYKKGWLKTAPPPKWSREKDLGEVTFVTRVRDGKLFRLKEPPDRLRHSFEIARFFGKIAGHEVKPSLPINRQPPKHEDPVQFLDAWCAGPGRHISFGSSTNHADFMTGFLKIAGVVFTHTENNIAGRAETKRRIARQLIKDFDLRAAPPDYTQILRTYTERAGVPLPCYTPGETTTTDGITMFRQIVEVPRGNGEPLQRTGIGRSRKKATHDAARRAAEVMPEVFFTKKKRK